MPFVGRDDELAVLRVPAREAAAGSARVVVVAGDAGIGKSALVARLSSELADAGWATGTGGCVDIPGLAQAQLPFGPFLEALRRLGDGGGDDPAGRWLSTGAGHGAGSGPADGAHARFDAALGLLTTLSADRPLLVVLEDLQWADDSSLALLVHLARNLGRERVLLVGTVRTGGRAAATLDHLARVPVVRPLDLGPLPDAAVRDLVRAVGTGAAVDVEAVVDRAEGSPLVAAELARHGGAGGAVPPTLAASVRDRVRRCTPEVRAALAAAAALGRSADHGLLVALLAATTPGAGERGLVAAVHGATETGILEPVGDGYRFRHGLDRDVVYGDLLPGERRALHAAAADALAAAPGGAQGRADALAEVAEHRIRAGDHAAALDACVAAARAATAIDAHPEAFAHYERALDLWSPGAGSPAALQLAAAEAARWAGREDRVAPLLAEAARRATTATERAQVWERTAWFHRLRRGDLDDAARAVAELGDDRGSATAAATLATYATSLMIVRELAEARRVCAEALAAADRSGALEARATALTTLGAVVSDTEDADAGLALLAEAEAAAERSGHPEQWWRARGHRLRTLAGSGRFRDVVELVPEVLARSGPGHRRPPDIGLAFVHGAAALTELGRWAEAEALTRRGLAADTSAHARSDLLAVLARLDLYRGRLTDAAAHVRASAGLLGAGDDAASLADAQRVAAEVAAASSDLARARALVDEAIEHARRADRPFAVVPVIAAALAIEAEHGSGAGSRSVRRVLALRDAGLEVSGADAAGGDGPIEGLWCRAEALRAWAGEAPAESRLTEGTAWHEYAAASRREGRPYHEAYALVPLARLRLARGRRPAAAESLARAWSLASGIGAAVLAHDVEALARRARLPMTDAVAAAAATPSRAVAAGLTARETDVLELLAAGATNRRIAGALGISERTASVHVSNILAELGVRNRGEAAAAAHRRADRPLHD
jgi:DNA-binding CsgD family transcriptional regulator/tetratricopeptide (TPR) repeat protein